MNLFFKTTLNAMFLSSCLVIALTACEDDDNKKPGIPEPMTYSEPFFNHLRDPLSPELIYSKSVFLNRNSVIQSFDIAQDGAIYYVQIAGADQHQLIVLKGQPNQTMPTDLMTLKYFGHGTNMAIEEKGNETYVWINGYGTKSADGAYGGAQTFCRFKYESGKVYEHSAGDVFYLAGARNIHPAIDVENDLLAVTHSKTVSGTIARYFLVYKLSEALALGKTKVTLSSITYGKDNGDNTIEQTEKPTIEVKDLTQLKAIAHFVVPEGRGKLGTCDFQGFDVKDQFIYYYEGNGNSNDGKATSNAYLSVLDRNGNISARSDVKSILDIAKLKELGLADQGYMEAEGVKVKKGTLYLGFASRVKLNNHRNANILKY